MKKTLVALAALASVSAFAQSSVTIYGIVDAGIGSRVNTATTGIETNTTAIGFSGLTSSRLGFKGTEDLGGGMKAGFVVESGLTMGAKPADKSVTLDTSGTTVLGDRGSYLTLSGGFGEIKAGFQNTGARDIFIAYDAGGAINVAGSLNSSTGNDSGNANAYAANNTGSHGAFSTGIKYTAPTYNGLTVAGSFSKNTVNTSGTATEDTRTGQGYSLGGNYKNGPLSAGISYANAVTVTATAANDITSKTTAMGASYDLGVAKLFVANFKLDQTDAINGTSTSIYNVQRKSTQYGVQVPVNAKLTAFASMGTGTLQFGSNGYERDLKASQFGANYAFSKRTVAKFAYGTTKSTESATTETKVKETALAIVHSF